MYSAHHSRSSGLRIPLSYLIPTVKVELIFYQRPRMFLCTIGTLKQKGAQSVFH